jgi:hypothetical protein
MAAVQVSPEGGAGGGEASTSEALQSTSADNIMTPCEEVFNTVELLDMILMNVLSLHIPHSKNYDMLSRQIFALQRMNNTFYNHINGDTEVARALHLAPSSKPAKRVYVAGRFPKLRRAMALYSLSSSLNNFTWVTSLTLHFSRAQLEVQPKPWSKLLLFQPPITKIWARPTLWCGSQVDRKAKSVLVGCDSGLTVRQILDAGKAILCGTYEHGGVMFRVDIDGNGNALEQKDASRWG